MLTTLKRIYHNFMKDDTVVHEVLRKLQETEQAALRVAKQSERLDNALCFNCGPKPAKLRQLSRRLQSAVASH